MVAARAARVSLAVVAGLLVIPATAGLAGWARPLLAVVRALAAAAAAAGAAIRLASIPAAAAAA
jgi:hypothetical protein